LNLIYLKRKQIYKFFSKKEKETKKERKERKKRGILPKNHT